MSKDVTIEDYKYVECWHSVEGEKQKSWQRIALEGVTDYQQREANNYSVFATIQRFANPMEVKGEKFISPLYFDFDDADNPANSRLDAIKVVDFFMKELDVKESDIKIFFSGSKGFHMMIHERALGIEPRADLNKVLKHVASYLVYRLDLNSLDLVVYTVKRMIRLPNSIHEKTKLFKTWLSLTELREKNLDEIKALAGSPRGALPDSTSEINARPKAAYFYKDKATEYDQVAVTASPRYNGTLYTFLKDQYPACVEDILAHGWKKPGDRNAATVQLACFFKDAGYTQEESLAILEDWVIRNTTATNEYQKAQRIANTRSVVSVIFSKDNDYKFGCAFIRSLHGERKPGQKDYDRVKCAGDLCPCITDKEEQKDIELLHLSETGKAELNGKLIKTRVMVAGKKQTPFIVPAKIEYQCWGYKTCKKKSCPLYELPTHIGYKYLGGRNRELIQMAGSTDEQIQTLLRNMSEIPNCSRFNLEVLENVNIDELLVIPMADAEQDDAGRYVLRRIYSLGEIAIDENKYYEICGWVYPHPRNQEGTILLKSAKPLQDVVESFKLTDDIKKRLAVFNPVGSFSDSVMADNESAPAAFMEPAIVKKLGQICKDLTYNVTHIVQRDEALLGALLVQHSLLRIRVPWNTDPIRGWLELMLIGDTGTGKSELIEKLMRYTGLGTRVNAESTSRTGLTYKMEQSGPGGAWYIVWGAWPLADKELIWIDEATGIEKDQYGEMTMARSEGKLEVKRAVTAETPCRVRAILSGNVPKGKRLADYAQGIEALKDIFNNEDIRRFDFAIGMKTSDVDSAVYNQVLKSYATDITATALKDNMLFAWSRTPEQCTFTEEAVDEILKAATKLSKIYGRANEVPLVSPSDERNKVARLAAACAALTHSVDETGEKIIVYPGHVQVILHYLQGVFNAPGCGLNFLAQLSMKEEKLSQKGYEKLRTKLQELPVLKESGLYLQFVQLFARQKYLAVKDVEDMLNITKEQAKSITTLLTRLTLVVKTSSGLRKTALFNSYIQFCFAEGMFDEEGEDY